MLKTSISLIMVILVSCSSVSGDGKELINKKLTIGDCVIKEIESHKNNAGIYPKKYNASNSNCNDIDLVNFYYMPRKNNNAFILKFYASLNKKYKNPLVFDSSGRDDYMFVYYSKEFSNIEINKIIKSDRGYDAYNIKGRWYHF